MLVQKPGPKSNVKYNLLLTNFIPFVCKPSIREFTGGTGRACGCLLGRAQVEEVVTFKQGKAALSICVTTVPHYVMLIMLYLWGFSTFFRSRSMVKSLFRHIVCSERPKSCIWGVWSASSSIRRAHLGVNTIGGGAGVLSVG